MATRTKLALALLLLASGSQVAPAQGVEPSLSGTWYAKCKTEGGVEHYLIKRTQEGRFDTRMLYIDDANKSYSWDMEQGVWSIKGDKYQEVSDDEYRVVFRVRKHTAKEFQYRVIEDGDQTDLASTEYPIVTEVRDAKAKLPSPPRGYTDTTTEEIVNKLREEATASEATPQK